MTTIAVALAWVFSLCLHEFCHAIVAYAGGDKSVKEKGYLTFNPIRYAHPTLSLVMPLLFLFIGGIGLPGGAVYIERERLRSRDWESAVSLAGPASNLLLGVLLSIPFLFGFRPTGDGWFWSAYAFFIVLQISSVSLNILPIPGFDGFGAIAPYLPRNLRNALNQHASVGMWIAFLLLWYVRPVNEVFWMGVFRAADDLGVSPQLAWEGYRAFRFWDR